MGPKSVDYKEIKLPKDKTFSRLLKNLQDKATEADKKINRTEKKETGKEKVFKQAGKSAYPEFVQGVKNQLRSGLIGLEDAESQVRDYATKYNLAPPEKAVASLTNLYTTKLVPARRKTGTSAAYREILGRAPTEQEKATAAQRFKEGYYSSVEDLRNSLYKKPEYQKEFNDSYLDNYYDTMFGKQAVDKKGEKTGKRTFTFGADLLPEDSKNLEKRTGIDISDKLGKSFTGTPAEIEEQQQSIRDTRQYLYSAGLTNLQGEIDKETQSLKNEGNKEVAKIGAASNLYSNLTAGFWG